MPVASWLETNGPSPMPPLPETAGPAVYVLHENPDWIPPFRTAFDLEGVPLREWPLTAGSIDLTQPPPEGVFWSRLSASSHTRGNPFAKEYARAVLRWLEAAGRRVINGSEVLELEVSKVAQHLALTAADIEVPRTLAVFGRDDLSARAREFVPPFITKHNQGGKGLGVRRFDSHEEFDAYADGTEFEESADDITLLQEYLTAAEPYITRAEFIGGRFAYAVRVDTSGGSFELCPAEACAVPAQGLAPAACEVPTQGLAPAACEVPGTSGVTAPSLFRRRDDIDAHTPLIVELESFLATNGIEIAGVEFIETVDGRLVTYDVNTNTNYNPDVEAAEEISAARRVARFLGNELSLLR